MKDPFLADVVALANIKEPSMSPSEQDWARVEGDLSFVFPEDIKELIGALGSGCFSELNLFNPGSKSPFYALSLASTLIAREGIEYPAREMNLRLHPDSDGLFPIGVCSNRTDLLIKLNHGTLFGYDLFFLDQDRTAIHHTHLPLAQFVLDLYHRKINEAWATDVRWFIWGEDPVEPFFTQSPLDLSSSTRNSLP